MLSEVVNSMKQYSWGVDRVLSHALSRCGVENIDDVIGNDRLIRQRKVGENSDTYVLDGVPILWIEDPQWRTEPNRIRMTFFYRILV